MAASTFARCSWFWLQIVFGEHSIDFAMNDAGEFLVRVFSLYHFPAPFGQTKSSFVIVNQVDTIYRQILCIRCHQ
jgi:hypothetical protein